MPVAGSIHDDNICMKIDVCIDDNDDQYRFNILIKQSFVVVDILIIITNFDCLIDVMAFFFVFALLLLFLFRLLFFFCVCF